MDLRLIRNATMRLRYAGRTLLTDPDLAPKHSRPSFTGRSPNPLVDLPIAPEELLAGVEAVLVSHLHSDHFDAEARRLLPKDLPLFCQPGDAAALRDHGFTAVTPVDEVVEWRGITIARTPGQHGSGDDLAQMGEVSGFVLATPPGGHREPTLYWAGDSVWYEGTAAAIARFHPAVIVTHSSGALWKAGTPIVMDADQTLAACAAAPDAIVVAVHLDSLDHGQVSRADLRAAADAAGIAASRLLIPVDGAELTL